MHNGKENKKGYNFFLGKPHLNLCFGNHKTYKNLKIEPESSLYLLSIKNSHPFALVNSKIEEDRVLAASTPDTSKLLNGMPTKMAGDFLLSRV